MTAHLGDGRASLRRRAPRAAGRQAQPLQTPPTVTVEICLEEAGNMDSWEAECLLSIYGTLCSTPSTTNKQTNKSRRKSDFLSGSYYDGHGMCISGVHLGPPTVTPSASAIALWGCGCSLGKTCRSVVKHPTVRKHIEEARLRVLDFPVPWARK